MQPLDFLRQEYGFEPGDLTALDIKDVSADGNTLLAVGHDQNDQQLTMLIHVDEQPLLPDDFNGNGTVDAADYVVWQKMAVRKAAITRGAPISDNPSVPAHCWMRSCLNRQAGCC